MTPFAAPLLVLLATLPDCSESSVAESSFHDGRIPHDALFSFAKSEINWLSTDDPDAWNTMMTLLSGIQPLSVFLPEQSGKKPSESDPPGPGTAVPLQSRLIRFATRPRGHRKETVIPPFLEKQYKNRWFLEKRSNSPEPDRAELEEAARKNHVKRCFLLDFLSLNASEMDEAVQMQWLEAFYRIWILPPLSEGGPGRGKIRREEDGISSAEALLEWFAENEDLCEAVRSEARARLDRERKRTARKDEAETPGIPEERMKGKIEPTDE